MSIWTITDSTGIEWARVSPGRAVIRAMILGSAVVAVVSHLFAAPGTAWWPGMVALPLAALTLLSPDSARGLLFLGWYAVWWLLSDPDEATPWALVAALSVLVFHSAVAFTASGPVGQLADRGTVVRWLGDVAIVAAVTIGVWVLVVSLHESTRTPEALVGLSLLLVVGLVWLARGATPESQPSEGAG